jgi:Xaa-Pro dipeptidase
MAGKFGPHRGEAGPIFHRERALRLAAEKGFDGLLGTTPENVYYLSGFCGFSPRLLRGSFAVALWLAREPDRSPVVVPHSDLDMVAQFGTRGAEVRPYGVFFVEPPAGEALEVWRPLLHPFGPATLLEAVTGLLRDFVKPGERIGFDEAGLPPELAAHLQAESGPVRFSPASALIRRIRAVKTPEEVRRLRVAAEVAEAAVADALAAARDGVTEWELAVRFNASVLRRGAWPGFAVVAFGERSAYPNAVPSQDVRLRPADIIRFDVGCVYQGYCSDISRTAVFGEPPPRLAERFQAVAAGERAALARCRPGVRAGEVFEAAVQATREGVSPATAATWATVSAWNTTTCPYWLPVGSRSWRWAWSWRWKRPTMSSGSAAFRWRTRCW